MVVCVPHTSTAESIEKGTTAAYQVVGELRVGPPQSVAQLLDPDRAVLLIFELGELPDHRLEHPKGVGLNVRQVLWVNFLHKGGIDWDQ